MIKHTAMLCALLLGSCATTPNSQQDPAPVENPTAQTAPVGDWPRAVDVVVEPSHAQIVVAGTGEALGQGTATIECPDKAFRVELAISAPGYEVVTVDVDAASPNRIEVRLPIRSTEADAPDEGGEEGGGEEGSEGYREDFGVE